MSKPQRYLNLSKTTWDNIATHGDLNLSSKLVRKNVHGRLLDACGRLQFGFYKEKLEECTLKDTIFIIGHWRSGTTYLHNLLASDPQFSFPSTSSCMNPHVFMLGPPKTNAPATRRPMDDAIITTDSPQEDEFALLGLGARSPYEALLFPRRLEAAFALADPSDLPPHERQLWEKQFKFFTKAVRLLGANRPSVLKSPTHSYRLRALINLIPTAKFILIKRDPVEVFESTFRMWRSLFSLYSIGSNILDNDLRNFIIKNRIKMETKIKEGLKYITKDNFVQTNYDELVISPLKR